MDTTAHDCLAAETLEYEAHYGAPGVGQAWRCTVCERPWARTGHEFHPAEDGVHIMTVEDVR